MTRAWSFMAAAALILAACSVLLTAVLFVRVSNESSSTTSSLCALRGDLETRIQTSTAFLKDHPKGIAGIPARTIMDGVRNQQRTVHALSSLSCS